VASTGSEPRAGAGLRASPRLVAALGALALAAAVGWAYAPVLACGFIWDDDFYVTANAPLRSPDGLRRIWLEPGATPQYYPLVHTSYWLEARLWGFAPAGYHAVNLILHALCAVLAWRVLLALGVPGAAAWLTAAVFALHPVHVESVAWITERKNVLSGAGYLGALLAYLRFLALAPGARGRARLYLLSFALYLGALASKTVTSTLAPALLLLSWGRSGRITARDVARLVPFLVAGVLLGLVTIWLERRVVGAVGPEWELSPIERVLIAGRALWFYLGKLLWPAQLAFIYPRWRIDAGAAWQYLPPAAALLALAALWLARVRIGRWPFVAMAFFAGTLVPALGFFDVYPMRFSFVADHFQYLASLGPIALAVALAERATVRLGLPGRLAGAALAGLALAALAGQVRAQIPMYRDAEALWQETIRRNPEAWIAWNNLGQIVSARGESQRAIELYRRAIALNERYEMGHYNLGSALADQGRLEEALPHLERAIEIKSDFADAHNNLGNALGRRGDYAAAIAHYRAALAIDERMAKVHYNLGVALREQGELAAASAAFTRAVELRPRWARARRELGLVLRARGEEALAAPHLAEAERLRRSSTSKQRSQSGSTPTRSTGS
jgi:tetratricopeptide (TPR) repeat protein